MGCALGATGRSREHGATLLAFVDGHGAALLRRIKNAFDARGIEIPYPHLSVYFGKASKPFAVQVAEQLAARESTQPASRREPSRRPTS